MMTREAHIQCLNQVTLLWRQCVAGAMQHDLQNALDRRSPDQHLGRQKAKAYQVRQVLLAIDKLEGMHNER